MKRPTGPFRHTAPALAALYLGDVAALGFGDGLAVIGGQKHQLHPGGMMACIACPSGQAMISAGDDGQVLRTDAAGASELVLDCKGDWIDALAGCPASGAVAISRGRRITVVEVDGLSWDLVPQRPANALAFSRDGQSLAAVHSAGVSLFDVENARLEVEIPCSGGPMSASFSPDGHFLFAGLSEPALAGWRLSDGAGFRMGGYPAKPRSFAWNDAGSVVLTSGGPALLAWPMQGQSGPMGQSAGVYRPRLGLVTCVAMHADRAAIGWSDGGVDLVELTSDRARHLGGPAPRETLTEDPRTLRTSITCIAFRSDGGQIVWGREDGTYFVQKALL